MKKYWSFFRIRFIRGLQYRTAALSGMVTQFVWGAMEILLFKAFYEASPESFPMTFEALSTYVWLQQAFLALYMVWFWESELFNSIATGDVAYELCRPVRLYNMWFVRGLAVRLSKAVLRCMPILIVSCFLPSPYGLTLPGDITTWVLTLLSMTLGLLLIVAFNMIVYMSVFYTVSSQGIKAVITCYPYKKSVFTEKILYNYSVFIRKRLDFFQRKRIYAYKGHIFGIFQFDFIYNCFIFKF